MNGSAVRSPEPSWEFIVGLLTRINPCHVRGTSPCCCSRSPLLGKHKQKRDCVLGAGEKLGQPFSRDSSGGVAPLPLDSAAGSSPELCWVQLGRGWCRRHAGPCKGSCSQEKCFYQSNIAVEIWRFGHKRCLKGGGRILLRCEVLSAGNLYGEVEGCPGRCGSLMENCIQQWPQRLNRTWLLKRWRCYKSRQQHFLIVSGGAWGREEAACIQR